MNTTIQETPSDADYPLALEWVDGRVVIFAGGRVLADTVRAGVVRASGTDAVWVIPIVDVQEQWLSPSARPGKGQPERQYFDLLVSGERIPRIAWICEGQDVAPELLSYMAFEPSLVSRVGVLPPPVAPRARA